MSVCVCVCVRARVCVRVSCFTKLLQVPYDSESLDFIAYSRGRHVAEALQQPMPAGAHFRLAEVARPFVLEI